MRGLELPVDSWLALISSEYMCNPETLSLKPKLRKCIMCRSLFWQH